MKPPTIALVDNGSLVAEATLNLRCVAAGLEARVGTVVHPVSLLHSSRVPAENLNGKSAEILEPWLRRHAAAGEREFLIVPFFFGPSRALTEYIPERVAAVQKEFPDLRVSCARPLVDIADVKDERIAAILEERVRAELEKQSTVDRRAAVALVDHGSPAREVTAVRDHVAAQLARRLGDSVRAVRPCSMERREGAEYDFNEPLLERLLDVPEFSTGEVIVAMLFLSPGRHAGPGGDVAKICEAAEARHPSLRTTMTALVGEHTLVLEILAERVLELFPDGNK